MNNRNIKGKYIFQNVVRDECVEEENEYMRVTSIFRGFV